MSCPPRANSRLAWRTTERAARQSGDNDLVGLRLHNLGCVALDAGDAQSAGQAFAAAVDSFRLMNSRAGVAHCQTCIAIVHQFEGDFGAAARALGQSLRLSQEIGEREAIGYALLVAASLVARPLLPPLTRAAGAAWSSSGKARAAMVDLKTAARLTTAGLQVIDATRMVPTKRERQMWDDQLAALKAALGTTEFEAAAGTGRSLGRDAAVAEALEAIQKLGDDPSAEAKEVDGASALAGLHEPDDSHHHADWDFAGSVDLTERELEVVGWLARDMLNREIAERMSISVKTVEKHVSNVLVKLGFENRRQVAAWGRARIGRN